jgi:hypothetical protein
MFGSGVFGQDSVITSDKFNRIESELYDIAEIARKASKTKTILKFDEYQFSDDRIIIHHLNDSTTEILFGKRRDTYEYKNNKYKWIPDYDTTMYKVFNPETRNKIAFKNSVFTEIKRYRIHDGDSILKRHTLENRQITNKANQTIIYTISKQDTIGSLFINSHEDTVQVTKHYNQIDDDWILIDIYKTSISKKYSGDMSIKVNTYSKYKVNNLNNELTQVSNETFTTICHWEKGVIVKIHLYTTEINNKTKVNYDLFNIKVKYRN